MIPVAFAFMAALECVALGTILLVKMRRRIDRLSHSPAVGKA
jgi:hypothetical protein